VKTGTLYSHLFFLAFLTSSLLGCANQSVRPTYEGEVKPDRSPVAALLAASKGATAGRLLKAALKVDDSVDLCEGLITHKRPLQVLRVKKPPFMKYYREPAFNTRVIRITDSGKDEVHKPVYSTIQAWNADESLLLLYRTSSKGNEYVLLDGSTYEFVKSLDISAPDIEQVFWSHNDPNTLFYMSKAFKTGGWLTRYNVRTEQGKSVRRFDQLCPNDIPTSGNGLQMQSFDDDLFGFRCEAESGHVMWSYRMSTDKVVSQKIGDGTDWAAWNAPLPTPSGQRMVVQGRVMSPELSTVQHQLDQAVFHEHGSFGRTKDGQDALFQTTFDPSPKGCDGGKTKGVGHLTLYNLESGSCRSVINETEGWPYTTKGTHLSALSRHRPGWVAMSSIGYGSFEYFDGERLAPPLFSEIYLVNTDPENTKLCRLAQHRSHAKEAENGDYEAYFGEPHVTLSPSGTRLLFGSDWYDSGAVDSYVIELPAHLQ